MTSTAKPPLLQSQWTLHNESATHRVAEVIARLLPQNPNLRIYLQGNLGAGKTTFVRALLRNLGVQGRIKSPTYALVESYDLPGGPPDSACHFDLYRLENPQEWLDSGLEEELLAPGLRLIEWPDKAAPLLPTPDLVMQFLPTTAEQPEELRVLEIQAYTRNGQHVVEHLMESMQ